MKIMLMGTYSSLNKGDFGMSQSLINEISKRITNVEFCIFTPFPEEDCIRYSRYFGERIQIHFQKAYLRNPLINIYLNLQTYLYSNKSFNAYDTIIDVSGDMIGEGYSLQNTLYHILYLNLFKNLGKNVILAPQSIGPFTYSRFFFKKILQHAKKIYVRDPLSFKYLQELELKNISLTGDLAFLLDKCENESNYQYLENIRNLDGMKFGLNLSYFIEKFFYADKKIDIVSIGVKLCKYLRNRFDKSHLIFIPHVFGPNEALDDSQIGKSIYDKLPNELKEGFIFIENELNHEELKAIISEMDLFIGARMHSCIGAISTSTPFINIAYSDKSVGLISQYLGLPKLYIDVRTIKNDDEIINEIMIRIEDIINDKKSIKKVLNEKSKEFKEKAEKTMDEICITIENKG